MLLPHLFKASPAVNIIVFRSGRAVRTERGGRLLLVGPRTSIAAVPAGDVPITFFLTERTRDEQEATVQGDVLVRLDPDRVAGRRNFVINIRSRKMEEPDELEHLHDDFRRHVRGLVRREVRARSLRENLTDVAAIERALAAALEEPAAIAATAALGGEVIGLFLAGVNPADAKLKQALEAEERERMLSAADKALHERRQENAERDRALKLYESQTALEVEKENARLVEQQALNLQTEARGQADAARIQLEPFAAMSPGEVVARAVLEMSRSGRIGSFHFAPEVMSAIEGALRSERAE